MGTSIARDSRPAQQCFSKSSPVLRLDTMSRVSFLRPGEHAYSDVDL